MNLYINETPKDLLDLASAFERADYDKVKEVSHKLKSLFKSYDLKELVANTIELENHAKARFFSDRSSEFLKKLQTQFETSRLEMIELRSKYMS